MRTSTSIGSSVTAEFMSTVTASLSLDFTLETENQLTRELEQEKRYGEEDEYTIGKDEIGLVTCQVNVYRARNGDYWLAPKSIPSTPIICKLDSIHQHFRGDRLWDPSGSLDNHAPAVKSKEKTSRGMEYYRFY
ncbi:MAG: hypothetical protein MJE77_11190 [Proteobacteria bacterium]|nr:hypothetical protein [Pseudomonadota bacterium]